MSDWTDTGGQRVLEAAPLAEDPAVSGDNVVAPPVRWLLEEHLDGQKPTSSINTQTIKKGVQRLTFQAGGTTRSVIVKRLAPDVAYRNQILITRWLPAVGLEDNGPILLGWAAEMNSARVWHMYEDLGELSLDNRAPHRVELEESVRLIAALHSRFADHTLLGECRLWGGDLGMPHYHSNAADAIRALQAIDTGQLQLEHRAALRSLRDTLGLMLDDESRRASLLTEYGGPETLLHGDLWRQNILLTLTRGSVIRPRLIDWDHVGVGEVGYDLSTLLSRFPRAERHEVLELYRRELSMNGWRLPDDTILNQLFDTAERARIANRVIWPAIEVRHGDHVEWALDHLIELSQWFDRIEPVLS
ncbi:MAG TPA: aminoglycoside phosphotransferase family protein [Acidimicrobiia bacterium]